MAKSRFRAYRICTVVAPLLFSAMLAVGGVHPAGAQVSAVKGSAFGFEAQISLFGGAQPHDGPTPTVTLPSGGSATPVTGAAPSGLIGHGPATFFTSDQLDVSTQGTPVGGSVTTSSNVKNVNRSTTQPAKTGSEAFSADNVRSTCTASGSGVSASTTFVNAVLQTDTGDTTNGTGGVHPLVNMPIANSPAPNTGPIAGHIHVNGAQDNFRVVLNEQITNPDGSITVNAVHQFFDGPTAKGDLIIGQSVCGVTATGATTTAPTTTIAPTTTTTIAPTTTTTTSPATTIAPTTTTASTAAPTAPSTLAAAGGASEVGGGAFGYSLTVSLFDGPSATKGPVPSVTLPAAGSPTPITAREPSALGKFGPATFFSSNTLEVSTQGTTGPTGSVTSSAKIQKLNVDGSEVLTADEVTSKCTASQSGASGSSTIANGTLNTDSGDGTAGHPVATVTLAASPAPNTSYEGHIHVNNSVDTFRHVFNEQIKNADGSITVNAVHQYLTGPTAKGDLIIGQSRCALTASAAAAAGSSGGGGASGGGSGVATTGTEAARLAAIALVLVMGGWTATYWAPVFRGRRQRTRRMPWPRCGLLG